MSKVSLISSLRSDDRDVIYVPDAVHNNKLKQILENIRIGKITPTFYGLQRLLNLKMGLKNTVFPHKDKLTKKGQFKRVLL